MIYAVKYIIFNESVVKPTGHDPSYPVNTGIRTSVVEGILVNVNILSLSLWIRVPITYQPQPRPIRIIDSIVVYLDVVNDTCSFFNQNCGAACTPVVKRVDYIIMEFYVI
ncbi:hypothetical protein SDC9_120850 [bioreactor metagenome]|uniref:Uncharacterized protein n=1 Tax=bioreactor metagenome TaxID=1076179 RepID=A0A645CAB3_9ZZZZ